MSSLRNASTSLFRPSAAASDKVVTNAAAPIGKNLIVKRILHVKISGSLSNMTLAGPQAAVWKPLSGKESDVLKPYVGGEIESAEAVNRLRTGTVRKVTLMEHNSSFPVPIGISMNCITPWETTDMGENYAYTVLPKSTLSTPQTVFEADTNEQDSASWKQMYAQYNAANLETEGVMDAPNQPWLFVNKNHPAIGLLQHNEEMLGCKLDQQPLVEGEWYKLARYVMSTCCQTIRTKVLSKIVSQDLNMLTIQAHRIDANNWDDLGDGSIALQGFTPNHTWSEKEHSAAKEHHLRQFLEAPYHYFARVMLEYEVPSAA